MGRSVGVVTGALSLGYYMHGRLDEARTAARRAMRFELRPEFRAAQSGAFSALLEVASYGGADPAGLAQKIEAWTDGLPDQLGRGLDDVEAGAPARRDGSGGRGGGADQAGEAEHARNRIAALLEVEIRANRAKQAEALLPDYLATGPRDGARCRAQVGHLRGEAADAATMADLSAESRQGAGHNWDWRMKVVRWSAHRRGSWRRGVSADHRIAAAGSDAIAPDASRATTSSRCSAARYRDDG